MPVPIPPPGSENFWNTGSDLFTMSNQEREEQRQEEEAAEREQTLSRVPEENRGFVSGAAQDAESFVDQGYRGQARMMLTEVGAPLNNELVRAVILGADALEADFDRKPGYFDAYMRTSIDGLIESGIVSQTPYSSALQASGFGFERPEFVQIDPSIMGSGDQAFLRNITEASKDYVVHPQTGWKQYKNGTLVDPNAGFGQVGAVVFDPSSRAPGSTAWATEVLPKWSQDKINEWRETLIQGGYLSSAENKGPVDVSFTNAMIQYQTVKYQNGGTPMDIGPVIDAGGGTTPYNFRQIRASIDEDVRNAWVSIYGVKPDESEVEAQRDMVIKVAKKLYQKGQLSPEGAASEAEARILGRMERTPEARFVTENVEENTELRDQMLRAVQVTSMMS